MKKVILSIILVCTLLCGVCIPSFAMHNEENMETEVHMQGDVKWIDVATAYDVMKYIYENIVTGDEEDDESRLVICSSVVYESYLERHMTVFPNQESVERFLVRFFGAQRDVSPYEDEEDEVGYPIGLHYFDNNCAVQSVIYLRRLMESGMGNQMLAY